MVEDQKKVVLPVLDGAESEEGGKERKEKHKKDKKHKHKHKHKHKSGHKRRREEEDGAEVETVHADVTRSPDPARLANGKVPHDVADKDGSDCESGEIPTAEDKTAQALESKAAGDRQGLAENADRPLGAEKQHILDQSGSDRYVWRTSFLCHFRNPSQSDPVDHNFHVLLVYELCHTSMIVLMRCIKQQEPRQQTK